MTQPHRSSSTRVTFQRTRPPTSPHHPAEPPVYDLSASTGYTARLDGAEQQPFCDECRPEAGHHQLVMNSPREGSDCYDNVMSWDGMPIGEPDF